ncbi:MAG TPA: MaoC family dehydratase N-terminal domain-containing protein [Ilumatobacteraceae bacterium]|nr:MaoC family dehydratase N-terminal domain-containing protein [Ilumatobacteraceae bacterium]
MSDTEFYERLQTFVGRQVGPPHQADDEVNAPMIRHMVDALGDRNPVYTDPTAAHASVHRGIVAPVTMLQSWVMSPFGSTSADSPDSPYAQMNQLLFSRGFTSVLATNCEQHYARYLRPGDVLTLRSVIESISPEKTTALGVGHFITTRQDYFDQNDELVGSMLFRILRFRPAATEAAPPKPSRPKAGTTPDIQFFFDALTHGRVQVQQCAHCSTLRHPPGPMCPACHSLQWSAVDIAGTGRIHSFIVVHYPQVPAFEYPLPVALIDLTGEGEDGLRMVMNTDGLPTEELEIGMAVRIEVRDVGNSTMLPIAVIDSHATAEADG